MKGIECSRKYLSGSCKTGAGSKKRPLLRHGKFPRGGRLAACCMSAFALVCLLDASASACHGSRYGRGRERAGRCGEREGSVYGLPAVRIRGGGCGCGGVLEISFDEAVKYRGRKSACSVIAYRAIYSATALLWPDEVPSRGDIKIVSSHPCGGSRDIFEFVTRTVTSRPDDFIVEMPGGRDRGERRADNFTFVFTRKPTGEAVRVEINDSIFPENFFEMRKRAKAEGATAEDKESFEELREIVSILARNLPVERLFRFTRYSANGNCHD